MTYTRINTETRPSIDVAWWDYGSRLHAGHTLDLIHAYFKMTVEITEPDPLTRVRVVHYENEAAYQNFLSYPVVAAGLLVRDAYELENNIITTVTLPTV